MAQKVVLIDDLDGSEGSETLTYTIDGEEYEIDLSEKNAAKFRKDFQPYIDASRRVERAPKAPTSISRASRSAPPWESPRATRWKRCSERG